MVAAPETATIIGVTRDRRKKEKKKGVTSHAHSKAEMNMLLATKTVIHLVTILAAIAVGWAVAQDVPYGVGDWPEALGNHRARIVCPPTPELRNANFSWGYRAKQKASK